jgi:hypothetical protein
VDGWEFERVREFKHLVSALTEENYTNTETKQRILMPI